MLQNPSVLIDNDRPPLADQIGLLLLSAAGLTYQVSLIRLFSVSQFYHFAFMIVSIAMLGYGASGTILAIANQRGWTSGCRSLSFLGLATAVSIFGSYLLINRLPFDSFSIAWDSRQVWILVLHYVALAMPFFFCGVAVGSLLEKYPQNSGQTYAFNLFGSALGCLIALLAPSLIGGEGVVTLSCGMAALPAFSVFTQLRKMRLFQPIKDFGFSWTKYLVTILLVMWFLIFTLIDLGARVEGKPGISWLALHISPYKSLSYALQVPGAELVFQRWNSFSRIDVVRSPSIHSFPGLSYRYLQPLPEADGLTVDGDNLVAIIRPTNQLEFTGYLPTAIAYHLRLGAKVLLLEPCSGPDISTALAQGANKVVVVEINPLIVAAGGEMYLDPRLELVVESGRSFLRRTDEQFDVIVISLTNSYHPVRSGAYSLAEDYRYTVEAFKDALANLNPNGILVVTRWVQTPPSESLRAFALGVTAVEKMSGNPKTQIAVFRGYNTATMLVKNSDFNSDELQSIRSFTAERAYDMVYAPDIQVEETNRFNILPESIYHQEFSQLVNASSRDEYYRSYPFNVTPPTDDHPFFGHYFKWTQARQILAEMGKIWQPFGGAGYFVIVALLVLAVFMAGLFILLPVIFSGKNRRSAQPPLVFLVYFSLIGFGFMLVEIPLIQRFILFLGQPAYAVTAVLFSLLASSAMGSRFSKRVSVKYALGLLMLLLLVSPWLFPWVFRMTLGLSFVVRLGISFLLIAPMGFLMGIPFPGGIRLLLANHPLSSSIAWIWATNGAASVVSSVLAALLVLTFGFDWVLRIGALCYAGAWVMINTGVLKEHFLPPLR